MTKAVLGPGESISIRTAPQNSDRVAGSGIVGRRKKVAKEWPQRRLPMQYEQEIVLDTPRPLTRSPSPADTHGPARYRSIVDAFAARIHDGELPPGTRLPAVRQLMRQHGIARPPPRASTRAGAAGPAVGETGRGTFVRDTSLPRGLGLEQRPLPSGAVDLTFNYPALPDQAELLREGLRAPSPPRAISTPCCTRRRGAGATKGRPSRATCATGASACRPRRC